MKIVKRIAQILGILLVFLIILGHTDIGNHHHSVITQESMLVEIGENTIRYNQVGKGKDLLLIHGTPGTLEDWNSISGELAESYRVTSFDRLGHGYSDREDYDFTLEDNAELVKDLVEKLDLKDPMIIGHSYGGSTVAHLIANHYNDDLKYMIIDSPLYDLEPRLIIKSLAIPVIGKAIGFFANYTIAAGQMDTGIRNAFANQTEKDLDKLVQERQDLWIQPKVLNSNGHESVNYQNDLDEIKEKYKAISADVIVVTGDDPELTRKEDAIRFCAEMTSDSLVIFKNTGHYIQFDQSAEIVKLIREKI